jgi:hypothetical protein
VAGSAPGGQADGPNSRPFSPVPGIRDDLLAGERADHQCNHDQTASPHCGTGIGPARDITGSWCDVDGPCASLPAVPPRRARAPRGNCRLFDTERRNPARDGLSARGRWIRTSSTATTSRLLADLYAHNAPRQGSSDQTVACLRRLGAGVVSSAEDCAFRFRSPGTGSKKARLALIGCCLIRLLRRGALRTRCFPRQAAFQGGHEIDDGGGAAILLGLTVSPWGVFELIIPGNL